MADISEEPAAGPATGAAVPTAPQPTPAPNPAPTDVPPTPSASADLYAWFDKHVRGSAMAADTATYNRIADGIRQIDALLPKER